MQGIVANRIKSGRLTYQFDNSNDQLQGYYNLRQEVFTEYWKLKSFKGGADQYDKMSHTLTIYEGQKCVGGARLIIRNPEDDFLLPMETKSFQLKNTLKDVNFRAQPVAELSRLALLPEYRNGEISKNIYRKIIERAKKYNVGYIFTVCHITQARKSRMLCKDLDIEVSIRKNIIVPQLDTYEGVKMNLLANKIKYPEKQKNNDFFLLCSTNSKISTMKEKSALI